LRGSNSGPNYEKYFVGKIVEELGKAGVNSRIMIDCSHGNSQKLHENQPLVAKDIV
jgi:3-deoxy-7-phosphoheptulonate synthase